MKRLVDAVIQRLSIEPRRLHQDLRSNFIRSPMRTSTVQSRTMYAFDTSFPTDRFSNDSASTPPEYGGYPTSNGSPETDVEPTLGLDVALLQGWPTHIYGW